MGGGGGHTTSSRNPEYPQDVEAEKAGHWGPYALSRHNGYFPIPKPQHMAESFVCV